MTSSSQDVSAAEILFENVQDRFSNLSTLWQALRSRGTLIGSNGRVGRRRVAAMRSSKNAQYLADALRGLSDQDVSAFQALALVNKEQAEAAFRYTVIVNFTVPITLIIVVNQLLPGGLVSYFADGSDFASILIYGLIGLLVLFIYSLVVIAQSGVQAARDMYHLSMIEQGRRGHSTSSTEEVEEVAPVADT